MKLVQFIKNVGNHPSLSQLVRAIPSSLAVSLIGRPETLIKLSEVRIRVRAPIKLTPL
jgi:hypothetical protein